MATTTTSISATTTFSSSIGGEDYALLARKVPMNVRMGKPVRSRPMMGNVNEGKGLFAPIVVVTRNIVGKKRFNQLRGKAIALHSQVMIFYNSRLLVFHPVSLHISRFVYLEYMLLSRY